MDCMWLAVEKIPRGQVVGTQRLSIIIIPGRNLRCCGAIKRSMLRSVRMEALTILLFWIVMIVFPIMTEACSWVCVEWIL